MTDTDRAFRVLDRSPSVDAMTVLHEVLSDERSAARTRTTRAEAVCPGLLPPLLRAAVVAA